MIYATPIVEAYAPIRIELVISVLVVVLRSFSDIFAPAPTDTPTELRTVASHQYVPASGNVYVKPVPAYVPLDAVILNPDASVLNVAPEVIHGYDSASPFAVAGANPVIFLLLIASGCVAVSPVAAAVSTVVLFTLS